MKVRKISKCNATSDGLAKKSEQYLLFKSNKFKHTEREQDFMMTYMIITF